MPKKNFPVLLSTPIIEVKSDSYLSSIELEKYILGTLLTDSSVLSTVIEFLEAQHFSSRVHSIIFQSILQLSQTSTHIDVVMLTNYLNHMNIVDDVGGVTYLHQLNEKSVFPNQIESYCITIRNKWILRALGQYARELSEQVNSPGIEADSVLDEYTSKIFDLSKNKSTGGFRKVEDFIVPTFKKIDDYRLRKANIIGVPTNFKDLDELTGGFQKGELVIVAARPSVGKTSLALNMAMNASRDHNKKVGFISLEMSTEQLILRLLSMAAKIPLHHVRTGKLKQDEYERIYDASTSLYSVPFYIDDRSDQGINEIRAKVRRLKKEQDIDILFIDYLGLIKQPERVESVQVAIANATRALKALAKDLAIPIVVLSQLNRAAVDEKADKRPKLHNLRDSGAIEQDADVVIFLYREQYEKRKKFEELSDEEKEHLKDAEIIVAKQRNGPIGTVEVVFMNEYASFEEKVKQYRAHIEETMSRQEKYESRKSQKHTTKKKLLEEQIESNEVSDNLNQDQDSSSGDVSF